MKDSDGNGPMWQPGDRVWVGPSRRRATVIQQTLLKRIRLAAKELLFTR